LQLELERIAPSLVAEFNGFKNLLIERSPNDVSLVQVMEYFELQMEEARPGLAIEILRQLKLIISSARPIRSLAAADVFIKVISGVSRLIVDQKKTISTESGHIANLYTHIDRPITNIKVLFGGVMGNHFMKNFILNLTFHKLLSPH